MQILKIEKADMGGEKIIVTVSGYPHAQPVFDATLSEQELQEAVDAWAVNQTEIDSINNGTATPEIIEKHKPLPPAKTIQDITEVEDNVLRVKTSVMAENFYTESKVVDKEKDYSKDFDKEKLSDKATHPQRKIVNGKEVLDLEARLVALEGAVAELIAKKK